MFCLVFFPSFFLKVAIIQKHKVHCATSKIKRAKPKNDEQVGKVININNKKISALKWKAFFKVTVSTGPSEYMCRREGGKDRDKGRRQERENSVQENKEIAKKIIIQKEEKPFGCLLFVKDIQMNRQNLLRFFFFFFQGRVN